MATPALLSDPPASDSKASRPWPQLALLVLTFFTTTAVGMRYMHNFRLGLFLLTSDDDVLPYQWVFHHLRELPSGLPFSLTLLAILLTHEFGHYLACRRHHVSATLPYLLPAPSLSGAAGAIIRLKSPVRTRAALLSIGALGPLAGFAVAILTTLLGLTLSVAAPHAPQKLVDLQLPLLFKVLAAALSTHTPVHPGASVLWHPVLLASWIGLLITSLNLTPAGQLDGGHILYALSPRLHRLITPAVIAVLVLLGIFLWAGWLLWAALLLLPGMRHPTLRDDRPIPTTLLWLAPASLILLLLTATIQPFTGSSLVEIPRNLLH